MHSPLNCEYIIILALSYTILRNKQKFKAKHAILVKSTRRKVQTSLDDNLKMKSYELEIFRWGF